jgi:hypothetical protein
LRESLDAAAVGYTRLDRRVVILNYRRCIPACSEEDLMARKLRVTVWSELRHEKENAEPLLEKA